MYACMHLEYFVGGTYLCSLYAKVFSSIPILRTVSQKKKKKITIQRNKFRDMNLNEFMHSKY